MKTHKLFSEKSVCILWGVISVFFAMEMMPLKVYAQSDCDQQYQNCGQQCKVNGHEESRQECQGEMESLKQQDESDVNAHIAEIEYRIEQKTLPPNFPTPHYKQFSLQETYDGWAVVRGGINYKYCLDFQKIYWCEVSCKQNKEQCEAAAKKIQQDTPQNPNTNYTPANQNTYDQNEETQKYVSCESADIENAINQAREFMNRLHGKLQKEVGPYMAIINALPNSDLKNLLVGVASDMSSELSTVEGMLGSYINYGTGSVPKIYEALVPIARELLKQYDKWGYQITPLLSEQDKKNVERAVKVMRTIVKGGCG